MKKHLLQAVTAAFAVIVAAAGCNVDKDYTLDNIDGTVNVLPNLEFPVGNLAKVTIGDFIDLGDNDYITVSESGDYHFAVALDPISYDGLSNISGMTITTASSVPDVGIEDIILPAEEYLDAFPDVVREVSYNFDFNVDNSEFTDLITDIDYAVLDGDLVYKITPKDFPYSKVTFKNMRVVFPAWLKIKGVSEGYSLSGDTVTADNDVVVTSQGVTITLTLDRIADIPEGKGIVEPGHIKIDGTVEVSGTLEMKTADINHEDAGKTISPKIANDYSIDNVAVTEAKVQVNSSSLPSFDASQSIDIDGLPEFLTDGNSDVVIQLPSICAYLSVENKFPAAFTVGAKLNVGRTGGASDSYTVAGLDFPAFTSLTYGLNESGQGDPEKADQYKVLAGISNLLNPAPTSIAVEDITADVADSWIVVEPSKDYSISCRFSVESPLAFGAQSKIALSDMDINLGLDLGNTLEIKEVSLDMKAENTIPFGLGLVATPVDENGVPVPGITVTVSDNIAAGSLENPSVTPLTITLKTENTISLNTLKLSILAASDANVAGTPLNRNQGLELKDIVLKLPEGITTDLLKGKNE